MVVYRTGDKLVAFCVPIHHDGWCTDRFGSDIVQNLWSFVVAVAIAPQGSQQSLTLTLTLSPSHPPTL